MRALVLLALAACIPYQHTTVRTTARVIEPAEANEARSLVLHAETYDGVVVVTAAWPRTCRRTIHDTIETTLGRKAELAGTQNGNGWGIALVPFLVIVWPVAVGDVIIAEAVAAGSDSTSSADRSDDTLFAPCPLRARGIPVHVTLASGRQLDGTTDEHGELALLLPPAEPTGPIVLRSDAKPPHDIAPPPPPPPPPVQPVTQPPRPVPTLSPPGDIEPTPQGFAGVRAIALDCGLDGTVTFDITIGADGHVTGLAAVGHAEAADCLGRASANLRFPPRAAPERLTVPFMLRRPR